MIHPTHFIDGQWTTGSGAVFASTNPATEAVIWQGHAAAAHEIDAAVNAARNAFPAWAGKRFEERLETLEKFRGLIEGEKTHLAHALAEETGKPLWDSATEIGAMVGKLAASVDAYKERTGERAGQGAGFKTALTHKPYGVVAVYGPYNFPAHLPNGHILPALLAGNTVVFKPSELTPRIAELTVKLWERSGLLEGVLNLVQGERETGKLLSAHPGLDGLFFTGSSDTGLILHQQFADSPSKILALELGGNNPMIVHETAALDAAVFNIIQSAFMSAGQRCSCTRRLILTQDVDQEALLRKLVEASAKLVVGEATQLPEPYMGPLIAGREVERLLAAQDAMISAGARPLLPMTRLERKGFFLTPGILDVTDMKTREDKEYFGPLLQVIRAGSFEDAMREANNTRYGLTAGILTDKKEYFDRFLSMAKAGVVNWNRPTTGASATAPFGGMGLSGNLRPSAYYAADYCAHPVASTYNEELSLPESLPRGLTLA